MTSGTRVPGAPALAVAAVLTVPAVCGGSALGQGTATASQNCQGTELVLNLGDTRQTPGGALTAPLLIGVKPGAPGCTLRGHAESIILRSGSEPLDHPLERDDSVPVTDVPISDQGAHAAIRLTWTPAPDGGPEPSPNGLSVRLRGVHYGVAGSWNGGKVTAGSTITHTAIQPAPS